MIPLSLLSVVVDEFLDVGFDEADLGQEAVSSGECTTSLESMRQSGVTRSYESRSLASKDMAQDLIEPGISEIRLIGISLNDFVRPGDQPELNAAWRSLEALIRGDRPLPNRGAGLDIKALIIDPYCLGAQLRSHGESRAPAAVAGRLHAEVIQTAEHLSELEKLARQQREKTQVSFEFRLYRLPPILFLCRTDTASYVQQYYFWASRYAAVPIPVLRYRGRPERKWVHTIHSSGSHATLIAAGKCGGTGHQGGPWFLRASLALWVDRASRDLCVKWVHLLVRR